MAERGSRYRFELTRLEIAGVVVSTAAGLFIVFLLGVYAGRGLDQRRLEDDQVVRLPAAPAAEETPARDDALTFYETLAGDESASPGSKAHSRDTPAEPVGSERPVPGAAPAHGQGPPAALARVADSLRSEHPDGGANVARSRGEHTPAVGLRPAPPQRSPADSVAVAIGGQAGPPPSGQGAWSVQVTATREAQTAADMVRRLRARGYDAYIVKARRAGGTFYRVRVGHYPSMEHASQMVSRLRHEPGVPEAFVASD